jgi:hypothetical protein
MARIAALHHLFDRRTTMTIFEINEDAVARRLGKARNASDRNRTDQRTDDWLHVALQDSFPCSDPISSMRVD